MADYVYTKSGVTVDSLEQEISDEGFSQQLSGSIHAGNQLTLSFGAALTSGEEDTLLAIVNAHTAPSAKPGCVMLGVKDGVDVPSTVTDMAQLFVDNADGNLKIKFGDGTIVVLATNP